MIILASKSPRRHELMKYITEDFIVKSADTDETLPKGISPEDAVLRLSAIKAESFRSENDIIIGAVANDDVYRTLQVYASGLLTKEQALQALKIKRLFDQYVFTTNEAISLLRFVRFEEM